MSELKSLERIPLKLETDPNSFYDQLISPIINDLFSTKLNGELPILDDTMVTDFKKNFLDYPDATVHALILALKNIAGSIRLYSDSDGGGYQLIGLRKAMIDLKPNTEITLPHFTATQSTTTNETKLGATPIDAFIQTITAQLSDDQKIDPENIEMLQTYKYARNLLLAGAIDAINATYRICREQNLVIADMRLLSKHPGGMYMREDELNQISRPDNPFILTSSSVKEAATTLTFSPKKNGASAIKYSRLDLLME